MISLQPHNQVFCHLSQLTAAFTPRSSNYTVRVKKSDRHLSNHRENYAKGSDKCTKFSANGSDICKLSTMQLSKKRIRDIFYRLNAQFSRGDNGWKTSYISGINFNENKCGFPFSRILTPISTAFAFSPNNIHNKNVNITSTTSGNIIVREFRTYRNVKTESDRNPSFTGRFRMWIGLSKYKENKSKPISPADIEHIKEILNREHITVEEKERVKVAFAEGYIAGHDRNTPGNGYKWLKVTQTLIFSLVGVFLLLLVAGVYQASNNDGSMFRIRMGNSNSVNPEEINVTFDDVKGVNEAKQELTEVVQFLKNPEKFSALGGRLPKGVLLVGPPGTGKTLLARAVAGEARVPFFHVAGPEFDEILVGQGAKRVRDLFSSAKKHAPCVVFIDEIDSVGSKRTTSSLHPYANQTINQLLSEMDGFHQNEGVIVLGATNRRDDLDAALRRPGRFDVEVYVHKPTFKGRKEILDLYLSKILTKTVDVDMLARSTTGFTGAEIEAMVNQAALKGAIEGCDFVTMEHLQYAREKIMLGPELKGRMPGIEETRITAYHEAGHALVGFYSKESDVLSKVTIIPRGHSLGHTSFLPEKDVSLDTKSKLLARMDTSLGGRAAEELVFGPEKVTTGAHNDLKNATMIAEAMVKHYGMSEKVGFRISTKRHTNDTVGYGQNTIEAIDSEIKRILQESYERAKTILKNHAKEHKLLAEALLQYETLDVEEIKALLSGKKLDTITDNRLPVIDTPASQV